MQPSWRLRELRTSESSGNPSVKHLHRWGFLFRLQRAFGAAAFVPPHLVYILNRDAISDCSKYVESASQMVLAITYYIYFFWSEQIICTIYHIIAVTFDQYC
jgi:hypothetical protein